MNTIYFEDKPIAFFDGPSLGGVSVVCIVLKLSAQHFFRGYLVVVVGTNIKAKFLGLWCLLQFEKKCLLT